MATSQEQAQWVLTAQCSDRKALELLWPNVQAPLRGYLPGLVGDSSADDLLQEVLMLGLAKCSGSMPGPTELRVPRRFVI